MRAKTILIGTILAPLAIPVVLILGLGAAYECARRIYRGPYA